MWRRYLRLGLIAASLALAWWLFGRLDAWRTAVELGRAQQDLARGLVDPARRRLEILTSRRPGAADGLVDYLLGVCEASTGHPEAALLAFSRVPASFTFEPRVVHLEARAR